MNDNTAAAVERVIAFLQECDDGDIRAGIGAILGLGTDGAVAKFKQGLASAIEGEKARPRAL